MKCLYIVTNKNSFTKNSKLKLTINYGYRVLYNLFCFIILIFNLNTLTVYLTLVKFFIIFIGMEITKISLRQHKNRSIVILFTVL